MRSRQLLGREHTSIGVVEVRGEGPAAIALSMGGAPKIYPHTDPNEDAALLAAGSGGTLLAVADGHRGFEASELAVESLLRTHAERWISEVAFDPARWAHEALDALFRANEAIRARAASGGRRLSRTTLALALLRPLQELVLYASIGDSHVFHVTQEGALDLAAESSPHGEPFFLGHDAEDFDSLREKCLIGIETLGAARAVVLATDGLSERGVGVDEPEVVVGEAVEQASRKSRDERAQALAGAVVESALEAHRRNPSGDNVAAAVAWLGDTAG